MENRNINKQITSLSEYSKMVSELRVEALTIAEDILSKSPSYWNTHPDKAQNVLDQIEGIKAGSEALDVFDTAKEGSSYDSYE